MAKVLIVDDDAMFIRMTRSLLEKKGYEVITALQGQEGLEKTRSGHPDVILLDVMMPVMDGYTMLTEVRNDEEIKKIPVIMCTGEAQKEYVQATQGMDVAAYLTKPLNSSKFLSLVDKIMEMSGKKPVLPEELSQ